MDRWSIVGYPGQEPYFPGFFRVAGRGEFSATFDQLWSFKQAVFAITSKGADR